MKILRIFPRKTKATPTDENAIIARNPNLLDYADKIHISVAFTYDIPAAEKLYNSWKDVAPTEIGGPALNIKGEDFTPGMYLKDGYVITSRGCNNHCWFCSVWKREGTIRELPIKDGYIILDDNFLSCSESHINSVFEMLKRQKQKPLFTGGLEATLLTNKIALQLKELKPSTMFFAYDESNDIEPLIEAGKMLLNAGFTKESHVLRAYILMGYPGDTFYSAFKRIEQTINAGFMPMAMLYLNFDGEYQSDWKRFQRQWANPVITACNMKKIINS